MNAQIKKIEDVKKFVQQLAENDQLFHFESEPNEIICHATQELLFNEEQCKLINKRIKEICDLDLLDYAFECALEHISE